MQSRAAAARARRATLDQQTTHVNVLFYGEPGSGKTTAAACLARAGKIVFVDAESGLKRQPLETLGIPVGHIELHTDVSFAGLEGLCRQLAEELRHDPDAFVGVVLDSLTEIQRALIEQDAPGRFRLTQGDYGENTQKLRLLCRHYRDLPCHVAFTTHVKRDEDDDGEVRYRPALTPGIAGDLLGFVDMVCYARAITVPGADEPDYVGNFRPGHKYVAKDRFGTLPPRLISPTFDHILEYTSGRYTREALQAAVSGDLRDDLDPIQHTYIRRLSASKSTTSKEN